MASFFPSLQPQISNKLWFDSKGGSVVEDDIELLKEETAFNDLMKKEVNQGQNVTPMGQAKQKTEDIGWFMVLLFLLFTLCLLVGHHNNVERPNEFFSYLSSLFIIDVFVNYYS